eukprot:scaffold3759_cov425-Prasinococcus_capsulatus_cf.AAC.8
MPIGNRALVAGSEVLSGHVRYEVLEIMHLMVQHSYGFPCRSGPAGTPAQVEAPKGKLNSNGAEAHCPERALLHRERVVDYQYQAQCGVEWPTCIG